MRLNNDIQGNLKFILKNGFSIIDSKDLGMAKWCRLSNSEINIVIWNDRDDIDAILEYRDTSFNIFSLVKFLCKDFPIIDSSAEAKLQQIDTIIENKYNLIYDFLLHLTESQYKEYENFHRAENFLSLNRAGRQP